MTKISVCRGMFSRTLTPSAIAAAAKMPRALFFEPPIEDAAVKGGAPANTQRCHALTSYVRPPQKTSTGTPVPLSTTRGDRLLVSNFGEKERLASAAFEVKPDDLLQEFVAFYLAIQRRASLWLVM